jgi:23S rRNA pseudouridine1911/1915/1917 synthase
VHLSALGFPIVGDKLYGPEGVQPFLDYIDGGMTESLRARLGHERQALHAFELTFDHPTEGHPVTLHAPLPEDLVALWGRPVDRGSLERVAVC